MYVCRLYWKGYLVGKNMMTLVLYVRLRMS